MKRDLKAMCHIVNQTLGISRFSYPMYQNAPRPKGDFAAVRLRSSYAPQRDVTQVAKLKDGSLVSRTYASRILTFDILFVNNEAHQVKFESSLSRPDVVDHCTKYGFGYLSKKPTDLHNTSLETDWELREGVTVSFHTVRLIDVPVGGVVPLEDPPEDINVDYLTTYIEEVEGTGKITTAQGTLDAVIHAKIEES